ncbi:CobW family GTP-binding protein [Methylobrevis pamukkalensis]|uniref:Putative metal chaperone YciC n=1 Tax=Methylobrevis pamukkalensis TaxID=1439726 RepID=A0A1E3H0Q1_9HYPH|nr:GTP-binding protein [Methylobrevis pamukkalensis]ODN69151.1 putative metal chaperone YciC [Methylobrevis pamukkalensis]
MKKIRTTVLTGFLGAGKTTLLNTLLTRSAGEKIAVIVNEFGEVGIDGQLVVETEDAVIELNNGCLCCTVRGDLIAAIRSLVASGRPIDRIIVETSGLADPAPVIQSFILDEVMAKAIQLDAIVTVVDVRNLDLHLEQDEAREQIAFADVLLLNKTDLEPADRVAEVETRVRALNPLARILRTRDCAVSPFEILDIGAFDLATILAIEPTILEDHDHEHDSTISSVALRLDTPLDPVAFNRWINTLAIDRGRDLFRCKGVLDMAGEARRFVFHGVHMTLEGRPGKPWKPGEARVSDIVFIGRNLDGDDLRRGFEACLARQHALAS